MCVFLLIFATKACAETWVITAYDACKKCCGKTDGITASGKKAKYGYVACNWLKFGTKVKIKGLGIFTVEDRGATKQFGSASNYVRHLDVFVETHSEAVNFGRQYRDVVILKE